MNYGRKIVAVGLAAATLVSVVALTEPAQAGRRHYYGHRYHGGSGAGIAAGIIGGLALGALAAGASRSYYDDGYYGPSPGYAYGPAYGYPAYGPGYYEDGY